MKVVCYMYFYYSNNIMYGKNNSNVVIFTWVFSKNILNSRLRDMGKKSYNLKDKIDHSLIALQMIWAFFDETLF